MARWFLVKTSLIGRQLAMFGDIKFNKKFNVLCTLFPSCLDVHVSLRYWPLLKYDSTTIFLVWLFDTMYLLGFEIKIDYWFVHAQQGLNFLHWGQPSFGSVKWRAHFSPKIMFGWGPLILVLNAPYHENQANCMVQWKSRQIVWSWK